MRMTGVPREAPVRTLVTSYYVGEGGGDSGGSTGAMRILTPDHHYKLSQDIEDPVFNKHGDEDLTQSNFTVQKFQRGKEQYGGMRAGVMSLQDGGAKLIDEAYDSKLAQAQRLRDNQHYNLQGITRNIPSPDAPSTTEIGYTLPIQWFAYSAKKHFLGTFGPGSPAAANAPGSMLASMHPTLKRALPTATIPTAMPWNVSAPGQII